MSEKQTPDVIEQNEQSMQNIHKESNNDLIHVSFSKNGLNYEIRPKFKNVLEQSRELARRSEELLDGATAETIDEDQLSQIRKDMKPIKDYRRNVDETVKDVRRVFDDTKSEFTDHVNQLLVEADFAIIEKNDERAKKLNKDVQALRLKRNWEAVEEEYQKALEIYPELPQLYPIRLSFETFKEKNDRLATGAKSWKLNDQVVNDIKTYIQEVYNNNEVIDRLESDWQDELKKRYDETGDIKSALDLDKRYQREQEEAIKRREQVIQREAERRAKEKERQRQMEENAKKKEREREEQRKAQAKAKEKPSQSVADSPFGIQAPPKPTITQSVAQSVGLKAVAKRMKNPEWTLSDLESMNFIHRFVTGVYSQEEGIIEHASSPKDVMTVIKEIAEHTDV